MKLMTGRGRKSTDPSTKQRPTLGAGVPSGAPASLSGTKGRLVAALGLGTKNPKNKKNYAPKNSEESLSSEVSR